MISQRACLWAQPPARPLTSLPMSSNGEPQDEAPQSPADQETPYEMPEPEWDWVDKGAEPEGETRD